MVIPGLRILNVAVLLLILKLHFTWQSGTIVCERSFLYVGKFIVQISLKNEDKGHCLVQNNVQEVGLGYHINLFLLYSKV